MCVKSPDAILKAGTFNLFKTSTAFSLNGVDKKIISFSFATSEISPNHSSSISNFLNNF